MLKFAAMSTPVKVASIAGMLNGYKIVEVIHGGRTVSLREQNYYYIPFIRRVVTYKASTAREMIVNKFRKFNFRETINGYSKTIQVDASAVFQVAAEVFN